MCKSFAGEFRKTYEKPALPEEIASRFHVTERLGFNDFGETFLLSEKDSGDLFVLKKCRKSELAAVNEAELLGGLRHKGLPNYEKVIEDENELFVSRRYINGITLDEYMERETVKDTALIVNTMISLCDILAFLHSQPASIIHRDIKPSNIIICPEENAVTLIDFGISRKFSADSKTDTVYFGTQDFAPPEQYGFAQTDCRSDIFSLGVVLRYWLTGTADRNAEISDKALARITAKCTALAPEARFQSAAALRKSLSNYKHRTPRRVSAAVASVLAVCLLVTAVFFALSENTAPPRQYIEFVRNSYGQWENTVILEIRLNEKHDLSDYQYLLADVKFTGEDSLRALEHLWLVVYNDNEPNGKNLRLTAFGYAEGNRHRFVPDEIKNRAEDEVFTVWFPIHSAYAFDSFPEDCDLTAINTLRYQAIYSTPTVPPDAVFTFANLRACDNRDGTNAVLIPIIGEEIRYDGLAEITEMSDSEK